MWYGFFKAALFGPLVKYGFRARIVGAENVPVGGGAILASNHLGAMDSIVVPAMLPRHLTFPAKAELFTGEHGLGSKIVAWFLKAIKMVPMDRGGGRASAESLGAIAKVLAEGEVVAIYPEGTRSPDGRLYKGKTGMARMVLANDVPVIPVGVVGTQKVKGLFGIPWIRRPLVIVGEPLRFSQYANQPGDTRTLRWVTDETLYAIQQLTGQEYADVYASRVKVGDLKDKGSDAFVLPRPGGGEAPPVQSPVVDRG
ncbi:1-acyl-sn-glycerol-3-phosphate acyltransferase [Tessaracoccus rhinocerotis]|uniref:1-acyl-sn-glycerol-3-phosphate acyltransferase n=1 Tax=Tessaracoccus rhinocerotis TaxID=1689449 RepID=A0A553K2E4_9ACTN|nr:lysophospholipid acyltransferase family protein [Tessaracoccus rhinocerotis]TRY18854.1 1-acyl-sn-glycerol-3-phosphate acyltransferase [Tessaracoccus rhinocerotis]